MTTMPRNRIKDHRRIRAGDLVPHELNPRLHSAAQRAALAALYEEVGFARSLLAYELPDGRLKLIDGHLRQSMRPDMEVDVEVLDVDDDEARALLLSLRSARRPRRLRRFSPSSTPCGGVTDADSDVLANPRGVRLLPRRRYAVENTLAGVKDKAVWEAGRNNFWC